jgi:arylsulfatase A
MTKLFSPAFLILLLAYSTLAANEPVEKPNIIVIMADDLGYGDVSCYGATELSTPNIDQLAAEGQKFTSGYCSASTCTPTRYSMLTGSYAFRKPGTGIAPPNSPAVIQPGTETVASILQRAGYATGVVGKWHLGWVLLVRRKGRVVQIGMANSIQVHWKLVLILAFYFRQPTIAFLRFMSKTIVC